MKPLRTARSGQEALLEGQQGLGVVRRPTRRAGSGLESLPEGQEWL